MKVCSVCGENKEEDEFSFKNKLKAIKESCCKACMRVRIRNHYYKNKEYYLKKAKERNQTTRVKIKKYIWDYLKHHPCVDCNEADPIVLEFDHISDKISAISSMYRNYTLPMVIIEIKKCEVRCANCHRRKTAERGGWYKNIRRL